MQKSHKSLILALALIIGGVLAFFLFLYLTGHDPDESPLTLIEWVIGGASHRARFWLPVEVESRQITGRPLGPDCCCVVFSCETSSNDRVGGSVWFKSMSTGDLSAFLSVPCKANDLAVTHRTFVSSEAGNYC
ncbi:MULTISPECIES: hypothetical protein [unclassified Rhizobium]|uniref:hypothetical protein n=1 Tax=unclassified Rhizobium TaxID=2613769 RepID=UPI002B245837|nr:MULTISPECIES: hypothetical protein [unclassified Rhizobium]